jgi:vitamin B12 transporter
MARRLCICAALVFLITSSAFAQSAPRSVAGTVYDPLGAPLGGATVTLLRDGARVTDTKTAADGTFTFASVAEGRYSLEASAEGFAPRRRGEFFLGANGTITALLTLPLAGVQQDVVVTASASESPASQTGASVSVIGRDTLETLAKPDVLEALRLVPGASVVQVGARGGGASLFVRGGASNFNKVLIDGVPVNDIGGAFDFSNLSTSAIERVEVLRNPNSVLYGSDALAGVVSLTSRRGRTRTPELFVSFDGGNLGTHRTEVGVGGTASRLDYFVDVSKFGTDNRVPNNAFENTTFASRVGVQLGDDADVTFTVRHASTDSGSPNAFNHYGTADDSTQETDATYLGVAFDTKLTTRWSTNVRFASMQQDYSTINPTPTGTAFDPFGFGANYLGKTVTINGANGYSVTGEAILDYGGVYPTPYVAETSRNAVYGTVNGRLNDWLEVAGGGRVEHEDGMTKYSTFDASTSTRTNGGMFAEGRIAYRRVFAAAGIGYDHHEVFESAVTPRLSVAAYLRDPSTGPVGDTKITLNAGKGIKAPSIGQELSSLFALVPAPTRAGIPGLSPVGPERSRSFDLGIEQGFWGGNARARAAYFDNEFFDLLEYVSSSILPQLGVPPAAAAASGFGAYVNSSSYRAKGVELSADVNAGPHLKITASFTHLNAVVKESFGSSALAPAINPDFPGIEIGAYGPLVGAAPFRRPANSGNILAAFTRGRAQVALAAYFAGKSDDSTFLSDAFFGNSMLLPNHHLNPSYQKVDLSGSYQIHPLLKWYASVENLLDQDYQPAFGFPALPATFRTGVSVTFGGHPRRP